MNNFISNLNTMKKNKENFQQFKGVILRFFFLNLLKL